VNNEAMKNANEREKVCMCKLGKITVHLSGVDTPVEIHVLWKYIGLLHIKMRVTMLSTGL
jgi:hypothetical protein